MLTVAPRSRSGIAGESTNDEAYGVLPGEDRLVKDIMTREIAKADTSILIRHAIKIIRDQNVAVLIVCQDNEPVFALTEDDAAQITFACEDRGETTTMHELINRSMAIRCREDAILADAIRAMVDHRVRHVPVVDAKHTLVGALSLVNAVGALTPDAAAIWLAKIQHWSDKDRDDALSLRRSEGY
ncbi:MAG: CBS domain-containing protein [Nitrospira sp. BO4]|jgi:CBS domain-containing protein|nr:CBS domain-containing protein [Nitrospira sp. BO4]